MCGIAGLFHLSADAPADQNVVQKMTDVQMHRGPDGNGFFFKPGVGLGHRRLSIIDLAGGHQPMTARNERYAVTYNGEIYNFRALRKALEADGVLFGTDCDTEVLLQAYIIWGPACIERFSGMFAFAVWDGHEKTLFLARDPVGKKPLYYTVLPDGWFAFSSELKGLLAHPSLNRTIDARAVDAFLALGYVPDDLCILKSVHKLPAGHSLMLHQGKSVPQAQQYWQMSFNRDPALTSPDEVPAELRERLKTAVSARLVSDVPLGAFLSGGVDSSVVVALMTELMDEPVKTCSIGFDVRAYDETRFANAVAEHLDTDHHAQRVSHSSLTMLDKMADVFDEPFADNSCLPTYEVCRIAREQVTVALSGDGGDEVFGGYRRYKFHTAEETWRKFLPLGLRKPVFSALGYLYPKLDWAPQIFRAKTTLQALSRSTAEAYFNTVSVIGQRERKALRTPQGVKALGGYRPVSHFERSLEAFDAPDPLSAIQYLDFKTWLVGDILTKVDRTSMANSLEVRVPMLDRSFLEWAGGISSKLRYREGATKWVLKKAFETQLPDDILHRNKMGFSSPLDNWMKSSLRHEAEAASTSERLADLNLINIKQSKKMFDAHMAGTRSYGRELFSIIMLDKSIRRLSPGG